MLATKPIRQYRRLAALAAVLLAVILTPFAFSSGRGTPRPVSLARVTRAVDVRFGATYDWMCQLKSYAARTVVCVSQPNGFYSATYYVRDDGSPILETYVPPPA